MGLAYARLKHTHDGGGYSSARLNTDAYDHMGPFRHFRSFLKVYHMKFCQAKICLTQDFLLSTPLAPAGIETRMFYSVQRDEVYCKIRCPLERLQREAVSPTTWLLAKNTVFDAARQKLAVGFGNESCCRSIFTSTKLSFWLSKDPSQAWKKNRWIKLCIIVCPRHRA